MATHVYITPISWSELTVILGEISPASPASQKAEAYEDLSDLLDYEELFSSRQGYLFEAEFYAAKLPASVRAEVKSALDIILPYYFIPEKEARSKYFDLSLFNIAGSLASPGDVNCAAKKLSDVFDELWENLSADQENFFWYIREINFIVQKCAQEGKGILTYFS